MKIEDKIKEELLKLKMNKNNLGYLGELSEKHKAINRTIYKAIKIIDKICQQSKLEKKKEKN